MGRGWFATLVVWLACGAVACGGEQAGAQGDAAVQEATAGGSQDADTPPCSGCSDEARDTQDEAVHLHHVHLNVTDRAASMAFYRQHFNAESVRLDGETEALRAGATLILFDEVSAPSNALPTAFQHVGFGASDPLAWFDRASRAGVEPDTRGHTLFETNETPTVAPPGIPLEVLLGVPIPACIPTADQLAYMYVIGPDEERIEVWTGVDDRLNHLHFTSADPQAATAFFHDMFGFEAPARSFFLDDILFFFELDGTADQYAPTEEHVMGHIALSVGDLTPWLARARDLGVEIIAEPEETHGFVSAFLRGPDGLLLELVEAAPATDLCPAP